MLKRLEMTDPTSCMSRARDDEMTFVLLGRDAAAPAAIAAWVEERIRLGKNNLDDPQILEAAACCRKMRDDPARFAGDHDRAAAEFGTQAGPYRLFASPDHDWYMLAHLSHQGDGEAAVRVLYEGHHRGQAYEALMRDCGIKVPSADERQGMGDGSFAPSPEDWRADP